VILQKPVIPATVTDQIRLWELERDRFRFADGVLYSQFLCQKDFDLLRDHARVSVAKCCIVIIFTFVVSKYVGEKILRGAI